MPNVSKEASTTCVSVRMDGPGRIVIILLPLLVPILVLLLLQLLLQLQLLLLLLLLPN
ncbi:hypothetical protein DPMN_185668 [Dreissena polymorpha]|uniref:Uncharacterized protein n=1 Tax=Dreissena polymorpha TaxID=45954 RepID=A0A9D4DLC8_DREPO|nr:hypothetical protein DPMN_185668 [Dreissena polymorpha]